jgi:hypothetical protein
MHGQTPVKRTPGVSAQTPEKEILTCICEDKNNYYGGR